MPQEYIPLPSVADVIQAVSAGTVDCGMVPIENSIEGSVSVTVDLLAHEVDNLQIVREVRHPIRHRLIVRPGVQLEDITRVVSHPHANAQCRSWLRQNLPGVAVEAANSTAGAVEKCGRGGRGGLGRHRHGHRGRELRLRRAQGEHRGPRGQRDPFHLPVPAERAPGSLHPLQDVRRVRDREGRPGALLLILQEFAYRFINLTKIESRPSKQRLGDYIFFCDMEGKVDDPQIADALRCLNCKLLRLTVLGSYPVGRPPSWPRS